MVSLMMIALAAPLLSSLSLSLSTLLYRYQQTVVLASSGGLWRFSPRNKPSHAGEEEEQEEQEEEERRPDPEPAGRMQQIGGKKRRKLCYFEGNVVWLEVQKHADLIGLGCC